MIKRFLPALLAAAVLAAVMPARASVPATLVLKSGDRVRGDLVDLKTGWFVVSVRGAEQQIARDEVAAITFTNADIPAEETAKIQSGRTLVVLTNGDTFYGSLFDIGGTSPLRLSFRTPDGDREASSDQIARVYLSAWQGMPGGGATQLPGRGAPDLDAGGAGFAVSANPCWTNTGRSVRRGQRVTFTGTGEIQLSTDPKDIAGVAGSRTGRTSPTAPMPGVLSGALIARVGTGQPFGVGDQRIPISMPAAGQLWLGVNDDHCGDNRGQFKVQMSFQR